MNGIDVAGFVYRHFGGVPKHKANDEFQILVFRHLLLDQPIWVYGFHMEAGRSTIDKR